MKIENNFLISIVVPVYGCSSCLEELYARLVNSLKNVTGHYEIILVNDDSPDNAWEIIQKISEKNKNVKGIKLSRNFGQHHAITAGLDYSSGEWIVVMDCDLQDRPEEILKLYNKALQGYDVVLGKRTGRKDTFFRRMASNLFYRIFKYLTNTRIDNTIGTFRIMNRKLVNNLIQLKEQSRFFAGLVDWLGFRTGYVDIEHNKRAQGHSGYTLIKLFKMALNNILSFSDKPLKLCITFGFIMAFISGIFIFYKILSNLIYGTTAVGWTSLIASIFFSTGIIIFVLGIVGLYVGKIFEETKKRPLYIIDQTTNINL